MTFAEDQINELKLLFNNVMQCEEGGITYFLLPEFALPAGCTPEKTDLLLCPTSQYSYASRMFYSQRIQTRQALNWNLNIRILERNWESFSWRVPGNLRLAQMVSIHIKAFR